MAEKIPKWAKDDKTPTSVTIRMEPRRPETNPTLGVPVKPKPLHKTPPLHRLVAIGDSLTQGFQSGAIFNTRLSYPAIIAHEMGYGNDFRHPTYDGQGGLPLNLEYLLRELEDRYGEKVDWWESASALFFLRNHMARVEDWWERGGGAVLPPQSTLNHNLAVYGWDLRDTLDKTYNRCAGNIGQAKENLFRQMVENANDRAALRVLNWNGDLDLTPFQAAKALSLQKPGGKVEGSYDGIETLIVWLGANNALGAVTKLKVEWSRSPGYADLKKKREFTVWDPDHFESEFEQVVEAVKGVKARNVIFATVPHVTIAPIARGVGGKTRPGSRYFPYYTRPWISDANFDPGKDPGITGQQARAIDCAIDQYNGTIIDSVRQARKAGLNWYLLDICGILDRLAYRRYLEDPNARPDWWSPYPLPPDLASMTPAPDSRFFGSDRSGRTAGGLFSLDGIHPTTIGYGIIAQEFIRIMELAGVEFSLPDGKTPKERAVQVDFKRLIRLDTLNNDPPKSLVATMRLLDWFDEHLGWTVRLWN